MSRCVCATSAIVTASSNSKKSKSSRAAELRLGSADRRPESDQDVEGRLGSGGNLLPRWSWFLGFLLNASELNLHMLAQADCVRSVEGLFTGVGREHQDLVFHTS